MPLFSCGAPKIVGKLEKKSELGIIDVSTFLLTLRAVPIESTLQNEQPPIRWRPMGLSIGLHLLLVLMLLVLISRLPRSAPGEPDRFGEIVLAVKTADQKVEFVEESDDSPSSSVPSTASEISDQPPPPI